MQKSIRPRSTEQAHASITDHVQGPSTTEQGSSTTEQGSSTIEQGSSTTAQGPSTTEQGPSGIQTKPVPQIIVIPDDNEMAEIPNPFPFPATYGTNIDVALLTGASSN